MPLLVRPAVTAALLVAALTLTGCQKLQPSTEGDQAKATAKERAIARKLQAACSSPATYDRLKQVAFEDAMRIRRSNSVNLDRLATYSTVRMENPLVKSRDDALDVTVCSGRFVLYLPPGAERGFGGERKLTADIEYAAQMAADGSGMVYQIKGAEPIIYKIAAFNLKHSAYGVPTAGADTQLAQGDPPASVAMPRAQPTLSAEPELTPPPRPAAKPPARVVVKDVPRPSPAQTPPPRAVARNKPRSEPADAPRPRPVTAAVQKKSSSSSPSFNCRYARARSERMVCTSDRLAALDRAMSSQFYSVMSDADSETRSELRRSRDRFIGFRNSCSSEACVAQAYRDRMDEIRDIADDQ